MGRNFTNGIPARISVYSNHDQVNTEDIEIIKKHLSRYFNFDTYNMEEYEDKFVFTLKNDSFYNNIYECIREITKLTRFFQWNFFNETSNLSDEYKGKNFSKVFRDHSELLTPENYSLNIEYDNGVFKLDGRKYDYSFVDEQYWLYWDCDLLGYYGKYRIDLDIIDLGFDANKYVGEDESYLLYVVNNLKNANYKNELSKNNIFYIMG